MPLYMVFKTEEMRKEEGTIVGPLDSICVMDGELSAGRGRENIEIDLKRIVYKWRIYDMVFISDEKELSKDYVDWRSRLE